MKYLILFIIVVGGLVGLLAAFTDLFSREIKPYLVDNNALGQELERIRTKWNQPAIAGALIEGEQILAVSAVGTTLFEGQHNVDLDSRFHIGSVTKSLTALLLAILAEEGKLHFEQTLGELLTDIPMLPAYQEVTLHDLLLNRAGIIAFQQPGFEDPDVVQEIDVEIPLRFSDPRDQRREVAKLALNRAPLFPPGEKALYSNVGWAIAGLIAEEATGRSYEELLSKKIFVPLAMHNTNVGGWPASESEPHQPRGHVAEIFSKQQGVAPKAQDLEDEYVLKPWMNPAGGVHTSIRDYARYAQETLLGLQGRGNLLDQKGYERLHTIHLKIDIREMYQGIDQKGTMNLGYGWALLPLKEGSVSMTNGSAGTFFAAIFVYPEKNMAFAGFTNAGNGMMPLHESLYKATGGKLY